VPGVTTREERLVVIKYKQATIPDMKLFTLGITALAVLAVMVAGCTTQSPASTTPVITATTAAPAPIVTSTTSAAPALPPELAGDWTLTTMAVQDGSAVTHPTTAITLTFSSDGNVYGNGGCNNYNGPYVLTGTTTAKGSGITIGPLTSTKMSCTTTSQQESTYLGMLTKTSAYVVDGTQLSLTDKNQNVLIYQRPSTIPTQKEGMLPA